MFHHSTRKRADVLVLVLLVTVVSTIAIAWGQTTHRAVREENARTRCAANLRMIVQSMNIYAADSNDIFPVGMATSATKYAVNTKPESADDAESAISKLYSDDPKKAVSVNDPWAGLYILVLRNQVAPKQFICEEDPAAKDAWQKNAKDGKVLTGITAENQISYSVAYPWMKADGDIRVGKWWTALTDSSLPVMSDLAPFIDPKAEPSEAAKERAKLGGANKTAQLNVNTQNHNGSGQMVAFSDVHVEWSRQPNVGQNNDNIWGRMIKDKADEQEPIGAGDIGRGITNNVTPFDIVMVPTRELEIKSKLR